MKSTQTITLESVKREEDGSIDFRYDFHDIATVQVTYFPDSSGAYHDFRVTCEGDFGIGYEGSMRHCEAISGVLSFHHNFGHDKQVGRPS